MTAVTDVAKVSRTVHFLDVKIVKAVFPTAPDRSAAYRRRCRPWPRAAGRPCRSTGSRSRWPSTGRREGARRPVKNDPPRIVFSQPPPSSCRSTARRSGVLQPGTKVERVINTRAFVALDDATGRFYVHIFDGFVEAPAIAGPWTAARSVPPAVTALEARLAQQNVIDLMTGRAIPRRSRRRRSRTACPR